MRVLAVKSFLENYRKSDSLSKSIQKNIVGGFIIKGISIVVNLLYVPLLITYLDSERYGIWIALTSFLTWFQFFDIGIGNGLRNRLTEVLIKNDLIAARKLISTCYLLVFLIFLFISIVFSICAFQIDWNSFLNVKNVKSSELGLLALIVSVGMCFQFVVQLIQPILFAKQKAAFSSAFPAVSNLICLITIYCCTKVQLDSPRLLTTALILSTVPFFTYLIGSLLIFNTREFKEIKPGIRFIDFSYTKSLISLGLKFLFIQIAAVVINSSASIILIRLFGPGDVTIYNVVYKYFQVILMINVIFVTPLWSGFTQKLIAQDYNWISNTIAKMNRISYVLVFLIFLMLLISPIMFKIWVGESVSIPLSVTISMSVFFAQTILISTYNMFINGSGKIKLSMYFTAFEILTYLTLAYLLSKYVMGMNGVIVASIITKTFTFILQYVQVRKIVRGTATGIWNE